MAAFTNRNQINQVIHDGVAILREHTPDLTYIATHPNEENKFIWTLHHIFQQDRNLLHSAFYGSEDHGIELTDANVANIATLKVAEVTREQLKLVVGGLWRAEKEFDRITKEYILGTLYMRTLMTHLASVSKKEFNSKRKRRLSDTIEYVKDELTKNLVNVWDYICEEKSYKHSYTLLQTPSGGTVFHMDVVNVLRALQNFCKADVTIDDPEQFFIWFREQESRTPEQILEEIEDNLAHMRDSIIYSLVGNIPSGDNKTMLLDFTKSIFDNLFWKMLFFQLNTHKLLIRKIAYQEKMTEDYARLLDEARGNSRGNYAGGKKRRRLKEELRF